MITNTPPIELWFDGSMNSTTTDSPVDEEVTASSSQTRAEFTRLSARGYVKIRDILVQLPDDEPERSSTVGWAVQNRRQRELVLYLLILTCWPWLHKREKPIAAQVWVRALTSTHKNALTWSPSSLSRAWRALEKQGLIERERVGQGVRITLCREDGVSGEEQGSLFYSPPTGQRDRRNTYFILPDLFWHDELFAKLTLPGLAMFLVIAKETSQNDEAWLSLKDMPEWYGISQKSAQKGIRNLDDLGLVSQRRTSVSAPLSPVGYTTRVHYRLVNDFNRPARADLQLKTTVSRKERLSSDSKRNR